MTSHEMIREEGKTFPYWEGADVRMSGSQADGISEGDTITLDGETATVTAIERFTARFNGRNLQQARIKTDAQEPEVTEQTTGWKPNRYAGKCHCCGCNVAAGQGTLYQRAEMTRRGVATKWAVLCIPCAEKGVE